MNPHLVTEPGTASSKKNFAILNPYRCSNKITKLHFVDGWLFINQKKINRKLQCKIQQLTTAHNLTYQKIQIGLL